MSTQPTGTEGRDWATKTIQISSGGGVVVTASCFTSNCQNGNKSRIALLVNNAKVADRTEEKADTSVSYKIFGNGTHELDAIAFNERADADRCTISVKKIEIEDFSMPAINIIFIRKKIVSTVLFSLAFSSSAWAGDTILWRGWADFGSCNRVKYYKDDFGISWPTNQSVGQTVEAEIYLARTVDEVLVNRLKTCAAKGVVAAGATALATSGSGAWPGFVATFKACLVSDGLVDLAGDNISIRHKTKCNW